MLARFTRSACSSQNTQASIKNSAGERTCRSGMRRARTPTASDVPAGAGMPQERFQLCGRISQKRRGREAAALCLRGLFIRQQVRRQRGGRMRGALLHGRDADARVLARRAAGDSVGATYACVWAARAAGFARARAWAAAGPQDLGPAAVVLLRSKGALQRIRIV